MGKIGGKRSRGRQIFKLRDGLAAWYAQSGLKLVNIGEQSGGTVAKNDIGSSVLVFSPEVRGQPQLRARCTIGHPFFVKNKGWCSLQPDVTARHYGMWCSELELEDWCLPPTHPDAVITHHTLDTFKSYDLSPMDSTAVITLCNMARKRSLSQSDAVTSVEQEKKTNNALVHRAKRPMNAFMLFAKKFRMEFTRMYPGRDNREISVLLGNSWQKMKMEERKMYAVEARLLAEQYKKLNPDCWKRKRAASWSVGT
ncbi:HMG box-containing protein 1 [Lamellibrachia satsuma]|nr:HMG box-containing protein 1 [Lamellibrachia satsuma]